MDPDAIFKRFFGVSFPEFGHQEFRRVYGEDGDSPSGEFHRRHGNDLFGDLHFRMQEQMEEMDKQMQEVFRIFTIPEHMPSEPGSFERSSQPGSSARDQMLKEGEGPSYLPQSPDQPSHRGQPESARPPQAFPFSGAFFSPWLDVFTGRPGLYRMPSSERRDHDIDQESPSKDEIVDIYQRQQTKEPSGSSFGTGRSVKVKTVVGADGVMEEQVHIKDSSGREETTVRRRMGDKSHTITTITDEKGQEERREVFENIDKDKMSEFNQQWHGQGQLVEPIIKDPNTALQVPTPRDGIVSSDNRGIFRKLFGF